MNYCYPPWDTYLNTLLYGKRLSHIDSRLPWRRQRYPLKHQAPSIRLRVYCNPQEWSKINYFSANFRYLRKEINWNNFIWGRGLRIRKWTNLWHRVTWTQKSVVRIRSSVRFHRCTKHFCYLISFHLFCSVQQFGYSSIDPPSSHYWPVQKK